MNFDRLSLFIERLIVLKKYRWLRFTFIILLALSLSLDSFDKDYNAIYDFNLTILPHWIVYLSCLLTILLVNIVVLVPRFLLKGKVLKYIMSIFGLAVMFFVISILEPIFFPNSLPKNEEMPTILIAFYISMSFISLMLIFLSSTSLVIKKKFLEEHIRVTQLQSLTMQNELKMLKQQINPHFLFNMINNSNVLLQRNPKMAQDILYKLEELINYQFEDSNREYVLLEKDIEFINHFLKLESIRRTKFNYNVEIEGNIKDIKIPPLLFIPFIENAVKHNADPEHGSMVNVKFLVKNNELFFYCVNSKPVQTLQETKFRGIGLSNIKRRLELLFSDRHTLEINDKSTNFEVKLKIKL